MANSNSITALAKSVARESLRKSRRLHFDGPPFKFAVRTDKSVYFWDRVRMRPDYNDTTFRVTFVPSFTTSDLDQSRKEVIKLYRKICRRIPGILQDYNAWHVTEQGARNRVKDEFRKNGNIRDSRVIDKLRIKGEQELQNYHWGRYHLNTVYRFLTPQEQNNPVPDIIRKKQNFAHSKFLTNFYTASDDIDK